MKRNVVGLLAIILSTQAFGATCLESESGDQICTGDVIPPKASVDKHVNPQSKKLFQAWRLYDEDTCETVSLGDWDIASAPFRGQISKNVTVSLVSNKCPPGHPPVQFNGVYYTWTSTEP